MHGAISSAADSAMRIEDLIPVSTTLEQRIEMAVRCRDCDPLPKIHGAGELRTLPDGTCVQLMHNGLRVVAGGYCGEWMQNLIARCRGHHEPQEERVFHEVVSRLPATATMIELGGYWSYYSLWFLQNAPARRALVVEPDPKHLAIGRANAALNGGNIEFVQAFVGRQSGLQPFTTDTAGTLDLLCISVPQILAERGLKRLDLLHCDAQGAELPVLEGCSELLRDGRIEWLMVSTHTHHITGDPLTHQRCLATLRQSGATIVIEHDVQESFSGDGLIVARCGEMPRDWPNLELSHNRYSESLFRNPLVDLALAQRTIAEAEARLAAALMQAADAKARLSRTEALLEDASRGASAVQVAAAASVRAQAEISALRSSTSWRLTAPLRRLSALFRRAA
jgi:FkbM family methyltransferase